MDTIRKIFVFLLLPAFLIGFMGACGILTSKKLPVKNYYIITYTPKPFVPLNSKRPYPYILQVGRFEVQRIYNRQNITYRYSPHQIQYYELNMWAVRPDNMIRDIIFKHFQASSLTNQVGYDFLDVKPDFRIEGSVDALEKYDAGDLFYAHLAMTLKLLNVKNGMQIWGYSFDDRKRVFSKEMVYTVDTLSSILQSHMDNVITSLDSLFLSMDKTEAPIILKKNQTSSQIPVVSDSSKQKTDETGYEIIPEKKR